MTENSEYKEVKTETQIGQSEPEVSEVMEAPELRVIERFVDHSKEEDPQKGTILKVKGDPKDLPALERKKRVKNLAGAITHGVRKHGEIVVRAFGPMAVYKAVKALAIARGYIATQGYDLYVAPAYTSAIMGGQEKTGIKFLCFVSKNEK